MRLGKDDPRQQPITYCRCTTCQSAREGNDQRGFLFAFETKLGPHRGHNGHVPGCLCERCDIPRKLKHEQTKRRKPHTNIGVNIAWVIWILFSIYAATHDTSIAPHRRHQQEVHHGR